ncbi:efflux RND transporter permease subunit [Planctomicrobium sp. SH527]|uniref:efflux RND transporter permease subunit n=1 Tax=Planctomicrobium sp. SH527 TaxID=3448123 RepID=UPI003F5BDC53
MLNWIISFSLKNRVLVLVAAVVVMMSGVHQLRQMPVDVFPDLNRPTVTIMTEAPGLAPEEVEVLVTRPMEYLLNGATDVRRVRSASGIGLSIVWVEFDWGTDIFRDRQIVAEKLQMARERLPENVNPVMAPISSIMGEILLLGLRSTAELNSVEDQEAKAMELRTLGEFTVRNRILAAEGVSQVTVMGGTLKQYQIITSPARLAAQNVTLQQLTDAARRANVIAGGGIMERSPKESLLRISGQSLTLEEIEDTPVIWRLPVPVRIRDVADVTFGGPVKRGDASVWTKLNPDVNKAVRDSRSAKDDGNADALQHQPTGTEELLAHSDADSQLVGGTAVLMTVQKQPNADTLVLNRRIDEILDVLQDELPPDIVIERHIFKQADFIESAVENVTEAVRDGAIWVVIVLFLLMGNFRTSVSSLTSMPLSILLTVLVFHWFGISINTMTLGGIAVAIGDLVDDSIVDIENIYRRLKENQQLSVDQRRAVLDVVYDASCEVRGSIVYATLIVILVMLPLFSMGGLEGRMFAPLGVAYITSLFCSLVVSLTFTPAFGSILLARAKFLSERKDPLLMRWLKRIDTIMLRFTLRHATLVLGTVAVLVAVSCTSILWMGGEFLPPFNEGTLTINVRLEPGTSLDESQRIAARAERMILDVPEVLSVARRTGRAELDEHAEGVNSSEIEVRLAEHQPPKPGWGYAALRLIPIAHLWGFDTIGRPRDEVIADVRDRISSIPGAAVNIGQPISHRLDHMMSGIRAQIAVKVFGQDLRELRTAAYDIQERMQQVSGVVDLQIEPQVEISQIRLNIKRDEASRYGLSPGEIADLLETAYKGRVVSQVLDEDRFFGLVVWYDETSRSDPAILNETILETPSGRRVALGQVVEVVDTTGPNTVNREHVQRRVVVFCNVQDRDLASVVADIKLAVAPVEDKLQKIPGSYYVEYSGQFEAQQDANQRLLLLSMLSITGVFLLLCKALESWRAAMQVLVNIPLAAFGSVLTLLVVNRPDWEILRAAPLTDWPSIWIGATTLSVAHWVGFITLIGIVSRNGIMMISHYIHLMKYEGETFSEQMIIRGSLERLGPVMMTAMTSFIGLLPLLFGAGQTGKEILYPLALVVFGGMLTSTILDQLVTPALFYKFGRKVYQRTVSGDTMLNLAAESTPAFAEKCHKNPASGGSVTAHTELDHTSEDPKNVSNNSDPVQP